MDLAGRDTGFNDNQNMEDEGQLVVATGIAGKIEDECRQILTLDGGI